MKIYEYRDYDHYKEAQVAANIKKLHAHWCSESTVELIAERYPDAKNIICHGARNGSEVRFFQKHYPEATVIGTDIYHTANDISDMVEWDFHEINEEWIGKFDLLYTNSFDHCYDPDKCLRAWIGQLNDDGVLCIELMQGADNKSSEMDPLEISKTEYHRLLEKHGQDSITSWLITAKHGKSILVLSKKL